MEMEEKRELETMKAVIMKHHQKAMALKKKNKMDLEKRAYFQHQKQEKDQQFKLKLKSLAENKHSQNADIR